MKRKSNNPSLRKMLVNNVLIDYGLYLTITEQYIKELQDKFEKKYLAEKEKPRGDKEEQAFQAYMETEDSFLSEVFPQILRKSFLISLFAFFERYSDRKIYKSQKKEDEIRIIKDIRDAFAHNLKLNQLNGRDKNRSKRVRNYIDLTLGIKIDQSDYIVIENSYCEHVINVIKYFFADYFRK